MIGKLVMNQEQQKIGVIGIGYWGKKLVQLLAPDSQLTVSSYGGKENRDWLSTNYPNVKYVESLETLLQDTSIEYVFIATPISTHAQLAGHALHANKHVWVEKPLAPSFFQVQHLIDIATQQKKTLFVDHIFTATSAFELTQKYLAAHSLPTSVSFRWEKWGSFSENIVWNLAYHEIYLVLEMFGDPLHVELDRTSTTIKDENILHFWMRFLSFSVEVFIDRAQHQKQKVIQISFTDTTLTWRDQELSYSSPHQNKVVLSRELDPLVTQIDTFFDLSKNPNQLNTHWDIVQKTTKICEMLSNI